MRTTPEGRYIAWLDGQLMSAEATMKLKDARIADYKSAIERRDEIIAAGDTENANQKEEIQRMDILIRDQKTALATRDSVIRESAEEIRCLGRRLSAMGDWPL